METPLRVESAPLLHLKKNLSPSVGAPLDKNGWKRVPKLTLYLPENLDIDSILRDVNPDLKIVRDKLVYILHLIYAIPSQKKDSIDEYSGYTRISKKILGSVIKGYRKYIDFLKEKEIVEEDNFVVGVKCSGLRFADGFRSKLKPVDITHWTLIKNILYLRKGYNIDATKNLIFLRKHFDSLQVDILGARAYLAAELAKDHLCGVEHADVRYNSRLLPIEKLFARNNINFSVDETAGRLHTPITQLKSELRKFLRVDGEILYSVDISNSQPFLLQSLLDVKLFESCSMAERIKKVNPSVNIEELKSLIDSVSSKEDVVKFRQIVTSGSFYKEFGSLLKSCGELDDVPDKELKENVKKIIFVTFFSRNTAIRKNSVIKIFERVFPNVYKIIRKIKIDKHNSFAIVLQNLEADIILNNVCKELNINNPEVPIFSLHDSVVTTGKYVRLVKSTIKKAVAKFLESEVSLKIERWN